mgnify:CR=1 FL=1
MPLNASLNALKFLIERYDGEQDREQLHRSLREQLRREIALNEALVKEARRISKNGDDATQPILTRLSSATFDSLGALGVPLADLFATNTWSTAQSVFPDKPGNKQHRQHLAKIQTRSDLIERTYHRLIFRRICAENSVLKRRNTLTNLEKLLAESKYAITGKSGPAP